MPRKRKKDKTQEIYSIGCVTLTIIKYFALLMTVAYVGSFIASGIIYIISGNTLTIKTLAKLFSLITYYDSSSASQIIHYVGFRPAKLALLLYTFAYSIKYGLMYLLVIKFKEVFKTIIKGKMFTDKNLDILGSSIKLALVLAFAQPVIMAFTIISTHVFFDFSAFDFSGILYLFVAVLLYMIFATGYNMEKKHESYDKELEDYRAEISELEIEKLKTRKEQKESIEEIVETTTAPKKRRRRKKKTTAKKSSDKQ